MLGRALPLLLLPLLLYFYIPLRAPHAPYVRITIGPARTLTLYQANLSGFITYVTGKEFSNEFRSAGQAVAQFLPGARLLLQEFGWAGVALGAVGALWLARRRRCVLALTGLSFLTLLVFNLFYGIGDIYAYYVPLYLIWALWLVCGVAALLDIWDGIWRRLLRFQVRHLAGSIKLGQPRGTFRFELGDMRLNLTLNARHTHVQLTLGTRDGAVTRFLVNMGDYVLCKVQDALQVARADVEQQAQAARHTLDIPDMADGAGQLDVPHTLTPHTTVRHLNAAFVADNALVTDTLIFTACTLPILGRSKYPFAEEPVSFRAQSTVIDRSCQEPRGTTKVHIRRAAPAATPAG